MRFFLLILALSVGFIWSSTIDKDQKKEENALKNAKMILEKMDKSLESHDHKEFLKMHADNFRFKFCKNTGSSVQDLKKILETDPNLSQTVTSKHNVISNPAESGVTKVSGNQWKFRYEEHLLLKNKDVYRTEGTINFIDLGSHVMIISADEECPDKIF